MRKPKYMAELLKIVFLWLGIAFVAAGFLCFGGILKPTADSMIQDQTVLGLFFALVGGGFIIAQAVLKAVCSRKDRLRAELLAGGMKVNGTVERVYLQKYTQYGNRSPYRVFYTYTSQGRDYHHKSDLLWEKPDLGENDPIAVYTDGAGRSTVRL